jgi:DNA-binding NarL/FixJ family response regulator
MIVDDHPFFRDGLAMWLNQQVGVTTCGEAGSMAEARGEIERLKPDVVIMDLRLGDGEGLELIRELVPHYPETRFLAMSQFDEGLYAHRALQAGARGYVMKCEATETVMAAIDAVMAGEIHLSPKMEGRVLQNLFPDMASRKVDLSKCSDRELQVFELLGAGRSTREIGEHLKLSPKTVETYRENLKKKLRLQDGAALLRAATLWAESGSLGKEGGEAGE